MKPGHHTGIARDKDMQNAVCEKIVDKIIDILKIDKSKKDDLWIHLGSVILFYPPSRGASGTTPGGIKKYIKDKKFTLEKALSLLQGMRYEELYECGRHSAATQACHHMRISSQTSPRAITDAGAPFQAFERTGEWPKDLHIPFNQNLEASIKNLSSMISSLEKAESYFKAQKKSSRGKTPSERDHVLLGQLLWIYKDFTEKTVSVTHTGGSPSKKPRITQGQDIIDYLKIMLPIANPKDAKTTEGALVKRIDKLKKESPASPLW